MKKLNSEVRWAWLFMAPSLVGIICFVLLPFLETIRRSFTNALGTQSVGLSNYISVLGNDAFKLASANTAKFICVCVPLLLACSLALALMIRAIRPADAIFKTSFLIPMAIPVASIVLLWQALFHEKGIINNILQTMGVTTVDFMGSSAAFWVLIGTYIWKNCGYDMVLWLSGLDNISKSLYEAAHVDGANNWQCFWRVTMPNCLPTLVLTAVLSLLNTFKVFREAYLVAGNYPHESIYMLQHLFNNWFLSLDLSRLTAAGVLVALVLLVFILIIQRYWGMQEE